MNWRVKNLGKHAEKGNEPWNKGLKGYLAGEAHYKWKGDGIGYSGLHDWARKNVEKPKKCDICGLYRKLELANKSHEYKRDVSDWLYVCRSCHRKYDRSFHWSKQGNDGRFTKGGEVIYG
jgi:hypothetical protein